MKCKNCKNYARMYSGDEWFYFCNITCDCNDGDMERECKYFEVVTNAGIIKSMTNEELAEFLIDVSNGYTTITVCDEKCDECSNDIETCVLLCERWLEKKVEE